MCFHHKPSFFKRYNSPSTLEMIRINTLKLGVMKTKNAKLVWSYWKWNRTKEFVKWFENEVYGDEAADKLSAEEIIKKSQELNTLR